MNEMHKGNKLWWGNKLHAIMTKYFVDKSA